MSTVRKAYEAWKNEYGLEFEPNYSKATDFDCFAAWHSGYLYGRRHVVCSFVAGPDPRPTLNVNLPKAKAGG